MGCYLLLQPVGKKAVKNGIIGVVLDLLRELENTTPAGTVTIMRKSLEDPENKLARAFNLHLVSPPAKGFLYELGEVFALEIQVRNNGPRIVQFLLPSTP